MKSNLISFKFIDIKRHTSAVFKAHIILISSYFLSLLSSCLSSPLDMSPIIYLPSHLLSPRPVLLSGQSSLCLLYLLSHFVKGLSGQPSDWPLGSARDEAILILSGITAKLVVFSTQTVAAE